MTIRIAASVLAIVAIGSIAAPAEISARGLAGGGRAIPIVGGHLPIARPALRAHTPFARFRHRRRFFDNGFAAGVWSYGDGYGGYYEPTGDAVPYDAPPDSYPTAAPPPPPYTGPVRERIIYVMPARPSCSTQTYKVPAESGGERSINVVRC
jgi:hypothetical protein